MCKGDKILMLPQIAPHLERLFLIRLMPQSLFYYISIHPAIQPASSANPRLGCGGSSLNREAQTLLPCISWVFPGAFYQRDVPSCGKRRHLGGILTRGLSHLI